MTIDPQITLTIAGNDASGGAGLPADLKTFTEYGTFGIGALTTIATMDPESWKHSVHPIDLPTLKAQMETALSTDQGIGALKSGMIASVDQINYLAQVIEDHDLKNYVLDPVMVCKGDDEVLNPELAEGLRDKLARLSKIITPNLFEAGQLSGWGEPTSIEEMKRAAKSIYSKGPDYIVITAGDRLDGDKAIDLFYDGRDFTVLEAEKVKGGAKHGAGCTFSAAITAGLALGYEPLDATVKAKEFVTDAIKYGIKYNKHVSPLYHSAHRFNSN